ncbi:hypothetical protein ACTJLC_10375 [Paraburkholderia sp. 22099]|jgi:hypothetical protein|uniref:hypothetical protein n=1 Tax=Paraburkholderia TaxID=1822464 RepID=UPI0009F67591|nr:hypothetical protein [Paraburkholderia terricola]MDR6491649.1 hypothetical protein [Paraburkholderia terricola]
MAQFHARLSGAESAVRAASRITAGTIKSRGRKCSAAFTTISCLGSGSELQNGFLAGLTVWQAEKARIDGLRFWHEVAPVEGFPSSATVSHIHPLGLVGNFKVAAELITLEMLNAVDPAGSVEYHRQILPYLNKYAKGYAIIGP